jgi:hypothetical protein
MAKQALVSDWITKSRTMMTELLGIYAKFAPLAKEAELTGRIVLTAEGEVKSNLSPAQFVGNNADIDVETFVGAFAAIAAMIQSIDDKEAAMLYEVKV